MYDKKYPNKTTIFKIQKSVDETIKQILDARSEEYTKNISQKVWRNKSAEYISLFTYELKEIFNDYRSEVINLITDKEIFKNGYVAKSAKKKYKTYEYLDEFYNRVVVDDIKEVLDETGKKYNTKLQKLYEKRINKELTPSILELVFKEFDQEFNFNRIYEAASQYLFEKKINWSKQVATNTENIIKQVLKKGFEAGAGSYDIAESIKNTTGFSYARAELIARTEVISSCNYADFMSFQALEGIVGYQWVSSEDERVRKTHQEVNTKIIKKGEYFIVGDSKLKYPGDQSLGAEAKEIINCRCMLEPIFYKEWEAYSKLYIRGNL